MPKVSVIIPTYNCGAFIAKAIESVLAQTMQDFEVIVVDDGSTDNTREILAPYMGWSQFRYVYQKNAGQSAARNHAAQLSEAEYLAFLDADDTLAPRALERMSEAMDHSGASWCLSDILKVIGEMHEVRKTIVPENPLYGDLQEDFVRRAMFFRRKEFIGVGMYDLKLPPREDWDINIRMFEMRKPFVYIGEPLYVYLWREGSCTTSQYEKLFGATERVLRKNHKRLADAGDRVIARIYAETMWDLGRRFFYVLDDYQHAFACVRESLAYDLSIRRMVHPFVHQMRQWLVGASAVQAVQFRSSSSQEEKVP